MLTPWRYGKTSISLGISISLDISDGYCGFRFRFHFFFNILVFISECLVAALYHSGNGAVLKGDIFNEFLLPSNAVFYWF